MQEIIDFIKGFDLKTIISLWLIIWYFTREINNDLERRLEKQGERIDRLYEIFADHIGVKDEQ